MKDADHGAAKALTKLRRNIEERKGESLRETKSLTTLIRLIGTVSLSLFPMNIPKLAVYAESFK